MLAALNVHSQHCAEITTVSQHCIVNADTVVFYHPKFEKNHFKLKPVSVSSICCTIMPIAVFNTLG